MAGILVKLHTVLRTHSFCSVAFGYWQLPGQPYSVDLQTILTADTSCLHSADCSRSHVFENTVPSILFEFLFNKLRTTVKYSAETVPSWRNGIRLC